MSQSIGNNLFGIAPDSMVSIFAFAEHLNAGLVCKEFRKYQYLAMQKIWKDAMQLLATPYLPLPNSSLPRSPSDFFFGQKNTHYNYVQEIRDSLMTKMNAIVPVKDVPGDQRIIGCFRSMFNQQRQEVVSTTLQSVRDAFDGVQAAYRDKLSFTRFIDNERTIYQSQDEVDRNLLDAFGSSSLITHFGFNPNQPLSPGQIRVWMNDPANHALLNRRIEHLVLGDALTGLPKEICRLRIRELQVTSRYLMDFPIELSALDELTTFTMFGGSTIGVPYVTFEPQTLMPGAMRHVPRVLCQMVNLRELTLRDQQLGICLRSLQILSILKNSILRIIPSLGCL